MVWTVKWATAAVMGNTDCCRSGTPWYGQLGGQTEPRWKLQMVSGVERSAVGWALRWADGAALQNTDGGRTGVEWSGAPWYGQLGGQTEPRWEIQMEGGVGWGGAP